VQVLARAREVEHALDADARHDVERPVRRGGRLLLQADERTMNVTARRSTATSGARRAARPTAPRNSPIAAMSSSPVARTMAY
jgi:hypothetical protein